MTNEKICKDCRHFKDDQRYPRCGKAKEPNPVYGFRLLYCEDQRTAKGACGLEGRLFEPVLDAVNSI